MVRRFPRPGGKATTYDAFTIWITTHSGRDLETPIWRQSTNAHHRNRVVLPATEFTSLVNTLTRLSTTASPSRADFMGWPS